MAKVLISPKAEKDIDDIADYIALDHPERAVKFLRFLSKKLIDLASTPLIGRERPALELGLRSFPIDSYIIFYKPLDDGIDIIRIIHSARDIDHIFTR